MKRNKLFALDIGTRSCSRNYFRRTGQEKYAVTDILTIEHAERSMLDGQIHDVLAVSNIISQIKSDNGKETRSFKQGKCCSCRQSFEHRKSRIHRKN